MTDQELRDLVAENTKQIGELRESQKETNKTLKELVLYREKSQKEVDETLRESARNREVSQKELDKQIKELGKQIGHIGNSFGRFTEGLFLPSLE